MCVKEISPKMEIEGEGKSLHKRLRDQRFMGVLKNFESF